jgi:hypothetical protein
MNVLWSSLRVLCSFDRKPLFRTLSVTSRFAVAVSLEGLDLLYNAYLVVTDSDSFVSVTSWVSQPQERDIDGMSDKRPARKGVNRGRLEM